MENLSGGCHCCCDCCCEGGKTKSTPSLCFRLRLEFDNKDVNACLYTVGLFKIMDICEIKLFLFLLDFLVASPSHLDLVGGEGDEHGEEGGVGKSSGRFSFSLLVGAVERLV